MKNAARVVELCGVVGPSQAMVAVPAARFSEIIAVFTFVFYFHISICLFILVDTYLPSTRRLR